MRTGEEVLPVLILVVVTLAPVVVTVIVLSLPIGVYNWGFVSTVDDNIDNYNKWKTLYENNISIFGTTIEKSLANINYNEQSKTISVIINDNGSFANKINGITNKYPSIKDYFVNLGYNCKSNLSRPILCLPR